MSRVIDENKRLSKKDRQWLTDRYELARIQRIDEATGVAATIEDPDEDETDATEGGYADWGVDDLRAELGSRELSKSGNKAELVARLEEHDVAEE